MLFRLFVDSSHGVWIDPDYSFEKGKIKIFDDTRTFLGGYYQYKWSDYQKFKFSVRYVNSEFKSIVNSWWETNTDLLFKDIRYSEVFSVHLISEESPINSINVPYSNLFTGVINLERY